MIGFLAKNPAASVGLALYISCTLPVFSRLVPFAYEFS
jgi:hypothetical protein